MISMEGELIMKKLLIMVAVTCFLIGPSFADTSLAQVRAPQLVNEPCSAVYLATSSGINPITDAALIRDFDLRCKLNPPECFLSITAPKAKWSARKKPFMNPLFLERQESIPQIEKGLAVSICTYYCQSGENPICYTDPSGRQCCTGRVPPCR